VSVPALTSPDLESDALGVNPGPVRRRPPMSATT